MNCLDMPFSYEKGQFLLTVNFHVHDMQALYLAVVYYDWWWYFISSKKQQLSQSYQNFLHKFNIIIINDLSTEIGKF